MMQSKLAAYEALELSTSDRSLPAPPTVWQTWLQWLVNALTPTTEPKISCRLASTGESVFDAYDPVTERRMRGLSEAELRVWLEQRHHPKPDVRPAPQLNPLWQYRRF